MKVLKITAWYPNPFAPLSGSFVNDQAKALHDIKLDVSVLFVEMGVHHLFSKLTNFPTQSTFANEENINVFRHQGIYYPKWSSYIFDKWVYYFDRLYQDYITKFGKPDILHAHNYQAGYAAYYLSQKYNLPYILTEHSSAFLQKKLNRSQQKIAHTVFENANKIIVVSNSLKTAIQDYTNNEIRVIPNLIDTQLFSPNTLKKGSPKFSLIAIGDLYEIKRFDLLINAFSKIPLEKRNNMILRIIGRGPLKKKLNRLIKSLGLNDSIFLLGEKTRQEVAQYLKESDVFILSSNYETFGIVIIEALATGLPVIATKCNGPEDIINKKNGLLTPVNDFQALKNAIEHMYLNYKKYDSVSIRQNVIDTYDKKIIGTKLFQLYEEVLK